MIKLKREDLKLMIEISPTVEDADKLIQEQMNFSTTKEKIAFLKGMFDVGVIIDQKPEDSDELIYNLLLSGILADS